MLMIVIDQFFIAYDLRLYCKIGCSLVVAR